jgi:hypothetical protein
LQLGRNGREGLAIVDTFNDFLCEVAQEATSLIGDVQRDNLGFDFLVRLLAWRGDGK